MEITNPLDIDDQLTAAPSQRNPYGRLNALIAANDAVAERKLLYPTRRIEFEVTTMSHPLDMPRTFAYLGAMLGLFPPASFLLLYLAANGATRETVLITWLLLWVNVVTTVTGYFTGKFVGSVLSKMDRKSFTVVALTTPLIGFLWGGVTGAAGGVFIFVIGAFFGVFLGGIVGAVALPVFLLIHKLVKSGDLIELKHFLPIASGVTFSICAFIFRSLH